MDLQEISREIIAMRAAIEKMQEYLMENEFEVSDEIVRDVEESRKSRKTFSHEDVVKEFAND